MMKLVDKDAIFLEVQYKAYWNPKIGDMENTIEIDDVDSPVESIEQAFKNLIDFSKNWNNKIELENLSKKINKLGDLILSRIKNTEEFEELDLEL